MFAFEGILPPYGTSKVPLSFCPTSMVPVLYGASAGIHAQSCPIPPMRSPALSGTASSVRGCLREGVAPLVQLGSIDDVL